MDNTMITLKFLQNHERVSYALFKANSGKNAHATGISIGHDHKHRFKSSNLMISLRATFIPVDFRTKILAF